MRVGRFGRVGQVRQVGQKTEWASAFVKTSTFVETTARQDGRTRKPIPQNKTDKSDGVDGHRQEKQKEKRNG